MADNRPPKRGRRYRIDQKFGYKPESDPPRIPPTSAKSKEGDEGSSASSGQSDTEKSSRGE